MFASGSCRNTVFLKTTAPVTIVIQLKHNSADELCFVALTLLRVPYHSCRSPALQDSQPFWSPCTLCCPTHTRFQTYWMDIMTTCNPRPCQTVFDYHPHAVVQPHMLGSPQEVQHSQSIIGDSVHRCFVRKTFDGSLDPDYWLAKRRLRIFTC